MGCSAEEIGWLISEGKKHRMTQFYTDAVPLEAPLHRVRITKPFYMGVSEVTVGQFRRFVLESGYKTLAERDDQRGGGGISLSTGTMIADPTWTWRNPGLEQSDEHPVVLVSWDDASEFCRWLGKKESKRFCMPTEAQWEYACRAGSHTRYWYGDDPERLTEYGNIVDATYKAKLPVVNPPAAPGVDGFVATAPVCRYKPNPWRLYDMYGNVWEFCSDWFAPDYYSKSPREDPSGPPSGTAVPARGGAWWYGPYQCRTTNRHGGSPQGRYNDAGFRVVAEIR
jgi:formylglycine-generating enzyme